MTKDFRKRLDQIHKQVNRKTGVLILYEGDLVPSAEELEKYLLVIEIKKASNHIENY
jgi:hypothetical protein